MPTHRWVWADPKTNDTWEMEINPNDMNAPHQSRGFTIFNRNHPIPGERGGGMGRIVIGKRQPQEVVFRGVARSRAQMITLNRWRGKRNRLHLTDDLGRTFVVLIRSITFDEQRVTARNKWRFQYTITCSLLGRA